MSAGLPPLLKPLSDRFLSMPAEPLSSVSSLEVHFDLLDLTELTDMSDQELAEVFADSDEENHNEPPAGKRYAEPILILMFKIEHFGVFV